MPASKNPSMYTDCHQVLEQAVESSGLVLRFQSEGKARNFRMRLNTYRKLLHEIAARGKPEGFVTSTPYDVFMFKQSGVQVNIVPRALEGVEVADLDGNDIELREDTNMSLLRPEEPDDLLDDVADIAAEIRKTGRVNLD